MNPQPLKMLCFEHVFSGLTCEKEGCTNTPMSFLILNGEKVIWCRKHYEYGTFWHDGFECYYTHDRGDRPFRVYVGENSVYIYSNPQFIPIQRYENVLRIFVGTDRGSFPGNTLLVECKPQKYAFIGQKVIVFETGDAVVEYHSPIASGDTPRPIAVGTENVYYFPFLVYRPRSSFPAEFTEWGTATLDPEKVEPMPAWTYRIYP